MTAKYTRFSPMHLASVWLTLFLFSPTQTLAQFRVIKPGFEIGELKLETGIFTSELAAIRVDPNLWQIKVFKGSEPKTAEEVCKEVKSVAAINANFFGTNLQPLGLIVTNSVVLHSLQMGGRTLSGVFIRGQEGVRIVHRDKFQLTDDIIEAVQAGPRLITDGQLISIPQDSSTRRSAIAIDAKGRVLLVASKDRFPGLSLKEFQQILSQSNLEIMDALNLDGGGSSQLYVAPGKEGEELSVSGGDKVPVFLTVSRIN